MRGFSRFYTLGAVVMTALAVTLVLALPAGSRLSAQEPWWAQLPPEKRALIERMVAFRNGPNRAPKDPALAPAPPAVTDPPFPTGLFEDGEAPVPAGIALFINRWQGMVDGNKMFVWAGMGDEDNRDQGVLLVMTQKSAPPGGWSGGYVKTPVREGAIRIIAVDEQTLRFTVQTAAGRKFVFDARAGTFTEVR